MPFDVHQAAKEIARASYGPARGRKGDVTDTIAEFARSTVRLTMPIREVIQLRQHLEMLRNELDICIEETLASRKKDTTILFAVAGRLREVNRKINCYRRIRTL